VVTLGDKGALVCDGESAAHFPAFPVKAVDTTAAGDAFNGALAVGLAAGGTLEHAIPLANAAAARLRGRGASVASGSRASAIPALTALRPDLFMNAHATGERVTRREAGGGRVTVMPT
jgi:sugar/nucleoside kinase (ribokinase family)